MSITLTSHNFGDHVTNWPESPFNRRLSLNHPLPNLHVYNTPVKSLETEDEELKLGFHQLTLAKSCRQYMSSVSSFDSFWMSADSVTSRMRSIMGGRSIFKDSSAWAVANEEASISKNALFSMILLWIKSWNFRSKTCQQTTNTITGTYNWHRSCCGFAQKKLSHFAGFFLLRTKVRSFEPSSPDRAKRGARHKEFNQTVAKPLGANFSRAKPAACNRDCCLTWSKRFHVLIPLNIMKKMSKAETRCRKYNM